MGKITIASDARSNDGPFPFFSRPERLGEYTLNRESVLTIGRADAKYLYNVSTRDEGVYMDLSKGFDSFEPKVPLICRKVGSSLPFVREVLYSSVKEILKRKNGGKILFYRTSSLITNFLI
uniref:DUF2263 domain-containing protein n=1 Tax=Heterorhabditis bacteriophora TaxID=37862 RepID=A0A1I7XC15_HETBA